MAVLTRLIWCSVFAGCSLSAQLSPAVFEAATGLPSVTAIATDEAGHIYLAGNLDNFSLDTMLTSPPGLVRNFTAASIFLNGYVARVSPSGDVIFWVAAVPVRPQSLQIDAAGNIRVSGIGIRSNVPGVITPCVSKDNPTSDPTAFSTPLAPALLLLAPDGSTMTSVCVGNGWNSSAGGITVYAAADPAGNVFLAGTASGYAGFKTTPGAIVSAPSAPGNYLNLASPYLITISPDLSQIIHATWLPGDTVNTVAADAAGNVWLGGTVSESSPLPNSAGSPQPAAGGSFLLRTEDGGQTFYNAAAGLPGPMTTGIARRNPASLVAWSQSALYISGDGGRSWNAIPPPPMAAATAGGYAYVHQAVLDDTGQTVYAVSDLAPPSGGTGAFRYRNGQWTKLNPPGAVFGTYPSMGAGPNLTVYFFTPGTAVSTDSGDTWQYAAASSAFSFAPLPADGAILYRVTGTNLEVSRDSGRTVAQTPLPPGLAGGFPPILPHPSSAGVFFGYTSLGTVRTTDFGQHWFVYKNTTCSTPDPASIDSVLCLSALVPVRMDLATGNKTPLFTELGASASGSAAIEAAAVNPAQYYVSHQARGDGFICKLTAGTQQVQFCSYLGGLGDDTVSLLTPASDGGMWVAGTTNSRNFPVTPGALQTNIQYWSDNPQKGDQTYPPNGNTDATLCHLAPDGRSFSACTLFGGSLDEAPLALIEGNSGSPMLLGRTSSPDIFTTPDGSPSPFQRPSNPGSFGPAGGFILQASADLTQAQFASVFTQLAPTAATAAGRLFAYGALNNLFPGSTSSVGVLDLYGSIQSPIDAYGVREAVQNKRLSVTPGGIARLTGVNLAPDDQRAAVDSLPMQLDGVQVSVDGTPVPLMHVSPSRIELQLPWDTTPGSHAVRIAGPQGLNAEAPMWVFTAAPVLFADAASNAAMVVNQDGTANGSSNPAPGGSMVRVLFSGVGNVVPPPAPGQPAADGTNATATVTAAAGPYKMPVLWAGASPGLIGISEVRIQIPTMPAGNYSFWVTAAGVKSNRALISIGGNQ